MARMDPVPLLAAYETVSPSLVTWHSATNALAPRRPGMPVSPWSARSRTRAAPDDRSTVREPVTARRPRNGRHRKSHAPASPVTSYAGSDAVVPARSRSASPAGNARSCVARRASTVTGMPVPRARRSRATYT
ncbi:hypothetical protein SCANM63S_05309 [Streptomyces canarius]